MTDHNDADTQPDWAAYQNLTPAAQTCLLLVATHDGDAWRGLIAQAAQEGLDVSDRHVRRTLAELEAEGLVESTTPSKRRQTYAVTEDGRETLAGMQASLNRALDAIEC